MNTLNISNINNYFSAFKMSNKRKINTTKNVSKSAAISDKDYVGEFSDYYNKSNKPFSEWVREDVHSYASSVDKFNQIYQVFQKKKKEILRKDIPTDQLRKESRNADHLLNSLVKMGELIRKQILSKVFRDIETWSNFDRPNLERGILLYTNILNTLDQTFRVNLNNAAHEYLDYINDSQNKQLSEDDPEFQKYFMLLCSKEHQFRHLELGLNEVLKEFSQRNDSVKPRRTEKQMERLDAWLHDPNITSSSTTPPQSGAHSRSTSRSTSRSASQSRTNAGGITGLSKLTNLIYGTETPVSAMGRLDFADVEDEPLTSGKVI